MKAVPFTSRPRRFLTFLGAGLWAWSIVAGVVAAGEAPPGGAVSLPQPPSDSPGGSAAIHLRVGLATDLESIVLPCCEGSLVVGVGDQTVAVSDPIRVEPGGRITRSGHFRLQVAALKDEGQARGLAERLTVRTGEPGDAVFDAGTDLYRVRVGRYPTREEAEAMRRRAAEWGIEGAWIVHEGGTLEQPGFHVHQGDETRWVAGRWLTIRSSEEGIRIRQGRYRGRILLYLNDRGRLNLINEVDLEEYLRGVVPREMGPEVYKQIEALKAQAVAARTYTLRNLGEFVEEGYDICATPRCQVYGGMAAEHPLTDQAIRETAGIVMLYGGRPVDALYSSTCGGHTENVNVVFPLKKEPYLQGVPCLESGIDSFGGGLARSTPLATGIMEQVLPRPKVKRPAANLSHRLVQLAAMVGLPAPHDRLASLAPREVQRFVASIFDLALDAKLFVAPQDLKYLLNDPPPSWSPEELRLAAYFAKTGLEIGALDRDLKPAEVDEMLLRLAQFLRVVTEEPVTFQLLAHGKLGVRGQEGPERYDIVSGVGTFRRRGAELVSLPLALVAGDRLRIYRQGEALLAVVQEVDPDGVAFDRTSPLSSWNRFKSDVDIARSVRTRYPDMSFRTFEIVSRGISGRVGQIRLLGTEGQELTVEGLAVRWTLGVPDTLFTARRLQPKAGPKGWLFTGRGWGHGVGMCQVGAFGMARRGHSYQEILHHYYTGIEIGRARLEGTSRPAP